MIHEHNYNNIISLYYVNLRTVLYKSHVELDVIQTGSDRTDYIRTRRIIILLYDMDDVGNYYTKTNIIWLYVCNVVNGILMIGPACNMFCIKATADGIIYRVVIIIILLHMT